MIRPALALAAAMAACGGAPHRGSAPAPAPAAATAEGAPRPAPPSSAPSPAAAEPPAPLSAEECDRAIEHALALLAGEPQGAQYRAQLVERRDEVRAECVARGRRRDYRCVMAAASLLELARCAP